MAAQVQIHAWLLLSKLQTLTDRELLDGYLRGNAQCFEALVERYKKELFAYILRKTLYDRDWANDVFQETFFIVIRQIKEGKYKEDGKLLAWMYRIARNMIINTYVRRGRIRFVAAVKNRKKEWMDIYTVVDAGEKPRLSFFEKRQALRCIRHLIWRLPCKQKQVLIMREYFGMSYREIEQTGNIKTKQCPKLFERCFKKP